MIRQFIRYTHILMCSLFLIACGDARADPATSQAIGSVKSVSTSTAVPAVALPDLGPAPEFNNEVWLNTPGSLNLAALRGKVALVEFWTFG